MGAPSGFAYETRKPGEVVMTHHGRVATTLRGEKAERFPGQVASLDDAAAQQVMARLTGNYKRGNERR